MRYLLILIGLLATVLGAIGVFLPVLPTTPFLLLAAYCFAKSSKRFHAWLLSTKLYQNHLESFVENRSMTLRTKITLLTFASTMLVIAISFIDSFHVQLFILFLMVFKYYYFIFRIRTI